MQKEVMKALGKENIGFRYDRIKYRDPHNENYINMEEMFIKRWQEENKKNPGLNHGQGILQDLFYATRERMIPAGQVIKIKPMHRFIVATVIQWLGTNVGFSFLSRCLEDSGYRLTPIKRKD